MDKYLKTASCTGKNELDSRSMQWVHLLPLGKIKARDNREWQLMQPEKVIAASFSDSDELPIDYEHQTDLSGANGKPAPAAGWIKQLEVQKDGIWGLIEWTKKAAAMIKEKEYRFISPVFLYDHATDEVIKILRAGLTNTPALTLTALAKKKADSMPDIVKQIAERLGLDDLASDGDILKKMTAIIELSKNPDPAQFIPIEQVENMLIEAGKGSRKLEQQQAETRVGEAIKAGTMIPALRDWGVSLCKSNPNAFDEFVKRTGTPFSHLSKTAQTGEGFASTIAQPNAIHAAFCKQLGLSLNDIKE